MEEFKHAAAHWLCTDSGHTFEEVYAKVLSVTGEARRRYNDDDVSLAAVSDAEFATMMFLDGCFLVWFIAGTSDDMVDDTLARRCYHSSGPNIFKDMFLLENQIPWVVLEALMEFRPLMNMDSWIHACVVILFYREKKKQEDTTVETSILDDSKPPHLLGLLRSSMIGSMPSQKRRGEAGETSPWILPKGAMFLSQIGVKSTASRAEWFANMNVQEKLVSGELSLSPKVLGHFNACRLVNMAALEATGAFATSRVEPEWDGGF
nr:unnamed protein product [Digitaria exilis]